MKPFAPSEKHFCTIRKDEEILSMLDRLSEINSLPEQISERLWL